jgi:hypothetical protein
MSAIKGWKVVVFDMVKDKKSKWFTGSRYCLASQPGSTSPQLPDPARQQYLSCHSRKGAPAAKIRPEI